MYAKLKIFLILASVYTTFATKSCDEIKLHGVSHNAEVLRDGLDRPNRLIVEKTTNTLYFGYDHGLSNNVSNHGKINLYTKGFSNIFLGNDNHAYGVAIDEVKHDIYLGRSDGIYKYDYKNDEAKIVNDKLGKIWSIYFRDVLYFYKEQLYTYSEGITDVVKTFDSSASYLAIDNHDVVFFSNSTGIYRQKRGHNEAIVSYKIFDKPNDGIVRAFAVDNYDQVYVCLYDGIYYVHKDTTTIEKVLDVANAFGVTFDNENNLIYSDFNKLVRLTKCYESLKRNNQPVNIIFNYIVHNHVQKADSQTEYID